MIKNYVTPVFDRKKNVEKKGYGKVELLICLNHSVKKYVVVKTCNPLEWTVYRHSSELKSQIKLYNDIVIRMDACNEELSIENLNKYLGLDTSKKQEKEKKERLSSATGFLDFMKEQIGKEKLTNGTLRHKISAIEAISAFGKLNTFAGLTPKNIKEFDEKLRNEKLESGNNRKDTTMNNYHKVLRKYARMAFELDLIAKNPYDTPLCKFKKGVCAERKPLTEEELKALMEMSFTCPKKERVRDLFIFSAFTGLAYIDAQKFDFKTMTIKVDDTYYINGSRVKTGNTYFTPILQPAMSILEKYDFNLPKITNQKMNDYLHLVEAEAGFTKPLTSHVARHSFATMVLSHDVPIEKLAKMLGHSDIKTTQIYAKIMNDSIVKLTQQKLKEIG